MDQKQILPKATIHLTWMPGSKNTADYGSKLHTNIVDISNADDYRHGVEGMLSLNQKEHVWFYKISKDEETYKQLPDHLIEGARETQDKLIQIDPTRTMSNNKIEQEEIQMCGSCIDKETCGVFVTTRSAKAAKKNDGINKEANLDQNRKGLIIDVSDPLCHDAGK